MRVDQSQLATLLARRAVTFRPQGRLGGRHLIELSGIGTAERLRSTHASATTRGTYADIDEYVAALAPTTRGIAPELRAVHRLRLPRRAKAGTIGPGLDAGRHCRLPVLGASSY